MYSHRSGFQLGKDYMTSHSRRRYRLSRTSNPNQQFDPSLWLVHYAASEPNYRFPVNQVPMTAQIQATLNARRYLMSQGQLVRKEFMLYDRNNWPHINVPGAPTANSVPQQGNPYARNPAAIPARNIQQVPLYPPQQAPHTATNPSPSRRPRIVGPNPTASNATTAVPGTTGYAPHPMTIEEEEDTAHGDSVDHVTQRDLSLMRYQQHHAWMEEVLSSPYPMNQIKPVVDPNLSAILERCKAIEKLCDDGGFKPAELQAQGKESTPDAGGFKPVGSQAQGKQSTPDAGGFKPVVSQAQRKVKRVTSSSANQGPPSTLPDYDYKEFDI